MEARLNDPRVSPAVPLIVGAFFAVVGLVLTLDNLDVIDSGTILRFWPVVLILVGATKLVQEQGNRVIAFVVLLAGVGLLGDNLGLVRFSLFDLWPLLFILVGAAFVARSVGLNPARYLAEKTQSSALAVFSERLVEETSSDYRGGSAAAFLGALKLDLTQADISSGPAVLYAHSFWGSVEILVPDHWEIVGEVTPFMAAFEVQGRGPADPTRQLIVRGATMMAGIEVKKLHGRKS